MNRNANRLLDNFHKIYIPKLGNKVVRNPYLQKPKILRPGETYYESNIKLRNVYDVEGYNFFGIKNNSLTLEKTFQFIPEMARDFVILKKIIAYKAISQLIEEQIDQGKEISSEKYFQTSFLIDIPHTIPKRPGKFAQFSQEIMISSRDENYNIRTKAIFGKYCHNKIHDKFSVDDLREIRGRFFDYYSDDFENSICMNLNRKYLNLLRQALIPDEYFTELESDILEELISGNRTAKKIAHDDFFRAKHVNASSIYNIYKNFSSIIEKCNQILLPKFPGVKLKEAIECAEFLDTIGYYS